MRISILVALLLAGCGTTSGNHDGCANKNLVCRYDLTDGGCEVVRAVCCSKPEEAACESVTPVESSTTPSCVSVAQSTHRLLCL